MQKREWERMPYDIADLKLTPHLHTLLSNSPFLCGVPVGGGFFPVSFLADFHGATNADLTGFEVIEQLSYREYHFYNRLRAQYAIKAFETFQLII